MKLVPPIALFTGGVLMAISILVAMIVWINTSYDSQLLLPQPPSNSFTSSVEQSSSLEGIKQACASVARSYDMQNQLIQMQSANLGLLLKALLWGIIGVGFGIGPIFIFIYFATRKHVPSAA